MASIPLPALHVNPPQQQDPLAGVEKLVQLKSLMNQQAIQQQQVQAGGLENQQRQMDLDSQKALQKAYMESNGDPDKTTQLAAKYGAKPQALLLWQNSVLEQKAKTLDLVSKQGEQAKIQADLMQGAHDAVSQASDADRPAVYQQQLMGLKQRGMDISQLPQQYPGDEQFKMLGATVKTHTQMVEDALKQSEAAKNTAQGQEATTQSQIGQNKLAIINQYKQNPQQILAQVDAAAPPDKYGALNVRTKAMVNQSMSVGDVDAAKEAIKQASEQVSGIEKETNPAVQQGKVAVATAEGQARANIEAKVARGSNAALAEVPPHLVAPASAAANKAGEDYAQAQSVTQRLQAMMDAAKHGNVVSYQLIPQEGALQVTTSQGVHRINMAEIQNYGGGSLWQKLQGHIGKALTGASIPDSVLNDMAEMQKIQQEGSESKYNNSIKTINETYGAKFQPVKMETKANTSTSSPSSPPAGATHIAMGSDGKKHYTNAKGQDLGIAQ